MKRLQSFLQSAVSIQMPFHLLLNLASSKSKLLFLIINQMIPLFALKKINQFVLCD